MITSYDGHSGVKAACEGRRVLCGAGMNVAESKPALLFQSRKTLLQATKGEPLDLLGDLESGTRNGNAFVRSPMC